MFYPEQEKELLMRWERNGRFFMIHLQQDLLGDWCLIRTWGEVGTGAGQQLRRQLYRTYTDAIGAIERIRRRRDTDGYKPAAD